MASVSIKIKDFNIQIINADVMDIDPAGSPKCNFCLTDAPYGIAMMNEKWDTDIALQDKTWQHIGRFLKSGSMLTAYSQPKTVFRMGSAIENGGFNSHGLIGWLHLSGFCSPARVSDKDDIDNPWYDYRYGSDSLRPVFEPVIIAQKPFETGRPQYEQILENNTGVYNIADSRVISNGKHPPNIMVSHHPDCNLDSGCSPHCPSKAVMGKDITNYSNVFSWRYNELETLFYRKKPSVWEKEAGLEGFDVKTMKRVNSGGFSSDPKFAPKERKNPHRTVKPIEASKYLANLFKPPESEENYCFIPFCGTGSDVIGAMLAGWKNIIAVEIDPYYAAITEARVRFWINRVSLGWDSVDKVVKDLKKGSQPQQVLF